MWAKVPHKLHWIDMAGNEHLEPSVSDDTDPNPSDASLSAGDYYSSSGVSFNARVEPTISSISRTVCEVVRSTIDGR